MVMTSKDSSKKGSKRKKSRKQLESGSDESEKGIFTFGSRLDSICLCPGGLSRFATSQCESP